MQSLDVWQGKIGCEDDQHYIKEMKLENIQSENWINCPSLLSGHASIIHNIARMLCRSLHEMAAAPSLCNE